jgi:hypothetical protein
MFDRLMARIAKFNNDHLDGSRKGRMMEQGGDEIGFFLETMHFAEGDQGVGCKLFKQTGDGWHGFDGGARWHHPDLHILKAVWHICRSGW